MRRSAILLGLSLACGSAMAEDAGVLAQKAARACDAEFRKAGLAGLENSVRQCHARAQKRKTRDAAAYCFMLDFMAADIALIVEVESGDKTPPAMSFASMNTRAQRSFDRLGTPENERGKLIAQWSNEAAAAFAKAAGGE